MNRGLKIAPLKLDALEVNSLTINFEGKMRHSLIYGYFILLIMF